MIMKVQQSKVIEAKLTLTMFHCPNAILNYKTLIREMESPKCKAIKPDRKTMRGLKQHYNYNPICW